MFAELLAAVVTVLAPNYRVSVRVLLYLSVLLLLLLASRVQVPQFPAAAD